MTIDIKLTADQPIYLQIMDHIRMQVAMGTCKPGERLPAIRELARHLHVDPGTVAKAYQELERSGILVTNRGRGTRIADMAKNDLIMLKQRERLDTVMERSILEAMGLGFTVEDIEANFTLKLASLRDRRPQPQMKHPVFSRTDHIHFMGSSDLIVELLASHFRTLYTDSQITTTFVGSLAGLMALECGTADIAGSHLLDEESGSYNVPFIRRLMPNETVMLITLVHRIQGLITAAGNPKGILSLSDLKRRDITYVNRQKGSGTRIYLDAQLRRLGIAPSDVAGYEHEVNTHTSVVSIIAQGQADTGLGTQSAAGYSRMGFIPLIKERYDLVVLQKDFERPDIQKVVEIINSSSFKRMIQTADGYDVSESGNIITVSPQ